MNETLQLMLLELTKLNDTIRKNNLDEKKYLTIPETAKLMNCSNNTVRLWIDEGELKPFQYKGTLRIRSQNLERFVNKYSG